MSNGDKYASNEEMRNARERINSMDNDIVRLKHKVSRNRNQIQSISDEYVTEEELQELRSMIEDNEDDIQPISNLFDDMLSLKAFIKWLVASGLLALILTLLQVFGLFPTV